MDFATRPNKAPNESTEERVHTATLARSRMLAHAPFLAGFYVRQAINEDFLNGGGVRMPRGFGEQAAAEEHVAEALGTIQMCAHDLREALVQQKESNSAAYEGSRAGNFLMFGVMFLAAALIPYIVFVLLGGSQFGFAYILGKILTFGIGVGMGIAILVTTPESWDKRGTALSIVGGFALFIFLNTVYLNTPLLFSLSLLGVAAVIGGLGVFLSSTENMRDEYRAQVEQAQARLDHAIVSAVSRLEKRCESIDLNGVDMAQVTREVMDGISYQLKGNRLGAFVSPDFATELRGSDYDVVSLPVARCFWQTLSWCCNNQADPERAQQMRAVAAARVGAQYFSGDDEVRRDRAMAAFWLTKALDRGGSVLEATSEDEVDRNDAVMQSMAIASLLLGELYATGEGVPQSRDYAVVLLEQAGRCGNADVMAKVAVAYSNNTVVKDMNRAQYWARCAQEASR